MSANKVIDFNKFEGPVFSGRSRGEELREFIHLDQMEKQSSHISVIIPEDTYSVTSSFFLGLFAPSVRNAGTREAFYEKFNFEAPDFIMEDFEGYIARALTENTSFH